MLKYPRLIGILSSILLSLCSLQDAVASNNTTKNETALNKVQKPSWVFVIRLDGASLSQSSNGNYQLIVSAKQVKSILAFTDRPLHKVRSISLLDFLQSTHTGANSFQADPPNVVISFDGSVSASFTVIGLKFLDHSIQYTLKKLGGQIIPRTYRGGFVLFVDSSDLTYNQQQGGLKVKSSSTDEDGNPIESDSNTCADIFQSSASDAAEIGTALGEGGE
jgi:hypothetical protein